MIRLLAACDPHLSPANPAAWVASYEDFNRGVWGQLFRFAEARQARAILVAGDLLHRKGERDLAFAVRTARWMKEAPCPVYAIAGNHDVAGGSYDNGFAPAYEALVEMGAIRDLTYESHRLEDEEGNEAYLQGASWIHNEVDEFLDLPRCGGGSHVHLGHFAFGPRAGDLYGERVWCPEDLVHGAHDVAVIGHHHWDQGVVEAHGKKYAVQGSLTWTSRHAADAGRRPAALEIEVGPGGASAKVLRPKVPSFEEVIDSKVQEQVVEEQGQLDEYMERLAAAEFGAGDPGQLLAASGAPAEVRERARRYLEEAEA